MRLKITHKTSYFYEEPIPYGLQQLRLTPTSRPGQTVVEWDTTITGGEHQLDFQDHHGNRVSLVAITPESTHIEVLGQGVVETADTTGVIHHRGYAPLWLFERTTTLTEPEERVKDLVESLETGPEDQVGRLHELSSKVLASVDYQTGSTDSTFTAEEALAAGSGVCQDHAHVFISAARHLGISARYISGYLLMDTQTVQAASHAWAEAWVDHLGWVGFDISNGISPDERYVRLATGLDYREAAPISGLRVGGGTERMDVTLQVQAQQ